jgi:hypothetical protein
LPKPYAGRRADGEVERPAALVVVAGRLHADLGDGLDDGLGVGEARFVLDFEDHRRWCSPSPHCARGGNGVKRER